jgi:hypothetical protein
VSLHVERLPNGPPVVLVHGSVWGGQSTWFEQRALAERWTPSTGAPFNDRLEAFLEAAEARRPPGET